MTYYLTMTACIDFEDVMLNEIKGKYCATSLMCDLKKMQKNRIDLRRPGMKTEGQRKLVRKHKFSVIR